MKNINHERNQQEMKKMTLWTHTVNLLIPELEPLLLDSVSASLSNSGSPVPTRAELQHVAVIPSGRKREESALTLPIPQCNPRGIS